MAGGVRFDNSGGDLAEHPSSEDAWADTEPFPLGPEDGDVSGPVGVSHGPGLVIYSSPGFHAAGASMPRASGPAFASGPTSSSPLDRGPSLGAPRTGVPALRWGIPLAVLLAVGLYAGLVARPGRSASPATVAAAAPATTSDIVAAPARAASTPVSASVALAGALSLDSLPPTGAGASALPPRWVIDSDPDSTTESTMVAQLARVSAGDRWTASTPRVGADAKFAVARYDALRAAPADWRVVTPLATEELYAVVRADSPLRYLDELRGRRIDVGAPGSARALSGAALYRQMFGGPLPVASASGLSRDAALQALLDGTEIDSVWVFDGQPSAWLGNLPTETRQRLRLLRLAPDAAASRRALQAYLPAHVASPLAVDGGAYAETVGVVSFLVTSASPASASGSAMGTASSADELLGALCAHLAELRRDGHPKWREVKPGLQLPTGLPSAVGAGSARQACLA